MSFPGGLQLGGGVTDANAARYLDAGASHVIVTSHVFRDGRLDEQRLRELVRACASCCVAAMPLRQTCPRGAESRAATKLQCPSHAVLPALALSCTRSCRSHCGSAGAPGGQAAPGAGPELQTARRAVLGGDRPVAEVQ